MRGDMEQIKEPEPVKEDIENQEAQIDIDEIVKERAETLRNEIEKMREDNADPHLKFINPQELTYDDLMIFSKAKNNELTASDFMSYSEKLRQYFKEQKHSEREKQIKDQISELKRKSEAKEIAAEAFDEQFRNLLREYDKERPGYESAAKFDSRAIFEAMIRNWLISSDKI